MSLYEAKFFKSFPVRILDPKDGQPFLFDYFGGTLKILIKKLKLYNLKKNEFFFSLIEKKNYTTQFMNPLYN